MKFALLACVLVLTGCITGGSLQVGSGPTYSFGDPRATPGNPASLLPDIRPRQVEVPQYVYLPPGHRYVPDRSNWVPRRYVRCHDGSEPIVYSYDDPRAGIRETRIRCPY